MVADFSIPFQMIKAFLCATRSRFVGYSNLEYITSFPSSPPPISCRHPHAFSCYPAFYILITANLLKRCTCVALDDATFNKVILLLLRGLKINMICDLLV
jgi:hypothetical protein